MDDTKLEYVCPFCSTWILKQKFKEHQERHRNDSMCMTMTTPKSLEEIEARFIYLGMWGER